MCGRKNQFALLCKLLQLVAIYRSKPARGRKLVVKGCESAEARRIGVLPNPTFDSVSFFRSPDFVPGFFVHSREQCFRPLTHVKQERVKRRCCSVLGGL